MQIQLTQVNDYGMELRELRAALMVQPGLSRGISCIFGWRKKEKTMSFQDRIKQSLQGSVTITSQARAKPMAASKYRNATQSWSNHVQNNCSLSVCQTVTLKLSTINTKSLAVINCDLRFRWVFCLGCIFATYIYHGQKRGHRIFLFQEECKIASCSQELWKIT